MIYNFGSTIAVNVVSIALIVSAVVYLLLGMYTA
jgi:hypothetical protein